MRILITLATALVLSGCMAPGQFRAIMQHPKTGQTVECNAENKVNYDFEAVLEHCIKGYEAAGYKRVDNAKAK